MKGEKKSKTGTTVEEISKALSEILYRSQGRFQEGSMRSHYKAS